MANWIDRTIAAISPAAGVRRIAARAALERTTALTSPTETRERISGPGGYRGGRSDRRATSNWSSRPRSANADGSQRKTLVGRSRDAAMNLPLATAAIDRRVTYTVGTGMMAIPQLDAERLGLVEEDAAALTAQIMRDYDRYMSSKDPDAERSATGYEQQEIVLRGRLETGDILGIRVMPQAATQPGRLSETAWKLIEGDRIVSPNGHIEGEKHTKFNGVIVFGVEQDSYGAAKAYHVLKKPQQNGALGRTADDTVRIPAWGSKSPLPSSVLVMKKTRPEQARGIPILAPVLETLKQISDLTEAELFAAVMAAMLAIVYKSPGAAALPEADYGSGDIVQSDGPSPETLATQQRSDYRLESGTVLELDTDCEVDVKSPGRPNPAFDPFFQALAKQLAAALETPVEVLLLSFEASYTASKAALENFYILVRREQASLSSHWCDPHYQCWLWEQVARGRYPQIGPDFFDNAEIRALWSDVRHQGDGKISLNPQQEAKAFEIYEAHGWATGEQITAMLFGGDYAANVTKRAGEHRAWVDSGLPVPNAKGGGNAPAAEHEAPATGGNDNGDDDGE
ncbi:phage portal protein [Sphingorhabdus pulchriflava]|uniref:Phage portal protein n=1 Tax=Sphingorhabdus pulchriflava TaxID=2292257 RepID=A0A371BFP1_9SPHN|nr:phage portal protein [Sphingorhabdus pulchriflava]RDV06419.1 phage portal protein [Sphingorhabdus pulchriflava]